MELPRLTHAGEARILCAQLVRDQASHSQLISAVQDNARGSAHEAANLPGLPCVCHLTLHGLLACSLLAPPVKLLAHLERVSVVDVR